MATKWTKKAAIQRMESNVLLQEVLLLEPRLIPILKKAKQQKNIKGYHRIHTYKALMESAERLVGREASKKELQTVQHHGAVMKAIDDLLPPDDIDLHRKNKV